MTFTTAPEAMLVKVAAGAIIHAVIDAGVRCRGCKTPFADWDTLHPLFRTWSGKCPDCHTRDIRLDFAHQNADE